MSALDSDVAAWLEAALGSGAPPLWSLPVEEARGGLEAMTMQVAPPALEVPTEDLSIQGRNGPIPLRRYLGSKAGEGALALFIHGGGWALGSIATHDAVCRQIAVKSGATIVSVDYRLAPEHPFPAGLHDCVDALIWCGTQRAPGQPLVVMGDSAGGNLSAALTLHARDNGGPEIAAQVLIYPCVDIDPRADFPSRRLFGGGEYFLGSRDLDWLHAMYMPNSASASDPLASPLRAGSHAGLPPALVITAGFDPLRDEGKVYCETLRASGVAADYRCYDGAVHGFVSFAGMLSSGRAAIDHISVWIRSIRSR